MPIILVGVSGVLVANRLAVFNVIRVPALKLCGDSVPLTNFDVVILADGFLALPAVLPPLLVRESVPGLARDVAPGCHVAVLTITTKQRLILPDVYLLVLPLC